MRVFVLFVCSLMLPALFGCTQGSGERCQMNSDCKEGLICCVLATNILNGGTCQLPDDCDLTQKDSGTDTLITDAKIEAAPTQDAQTEDSEIIDGVQPDTIPLDLLVPDTTSVDTTSIDTAIVDITTI